MSGDLGGRVRRLEGGCRAAICRVCADIPALVLVRDAEVARGAAPCPACGCRPLVVVTHMPWGEGDDDGRGRGCR